MVLLLWILVADTFAAGPFAPTLPPEVEQVLLEALPARSDSVAAAGENTRLISGTLAVLLGPFGAHRLYLGTTPKVAVIYGITFGGFGLLALLDLGHILFTKDLELYRNNGRVFMWNGEGPTSAPTPP